jgi:hypothetical protein
VLQRVLNVVNWALLRSKKQYQHTYFLKENKITLTALAGLSYPSFFLLLLLRSSPVSTAVSGYKTKQYI